MDPANAILLFVLFQATEKAVQYAGGKIADSMSKPIWEALEEKANWLAGRDETAKRWAAFSQAYTEAGRKLKERGRHPELAKQMVEVLAQFDLKALPDNHWLDELSVQLGEASLVNQKPNENALVELFSRVLSKPVSRAEVSETASDFISLFKDALFVQPIYQEEMLRITQWENSHQTKYDTRERYISQVIEYNENLDFVGIPELKDRQAMRIEDVFVSLQTQVEEVDRERMRELPEELKERNVRDRLGDLNPNATRRLTVNQALTESQRIVVLGDPGSGKTTLLKYIVLAFAENKVDKLGLTETRLPIFVRLYDYVAKRGECGKDGFSFTDYLNKYCADHLQLRLPPDFFEGALERGECCVCFDGLDELGAAGLRREIMLAVSAMANLYARNRFIVTSRLVGYEEAPLDKNDFAHHTVQPLSDKDIKLFIEKWYKARERDVVIRRERTEHLVKTVMGKERIKSLASNPLMLTIIALVHRIEVELPHERVKLYDKCVTTLVEKWDAGKQIKFDARIKRRLLERLAYWMYSQPGEKGRTREVREGTLRLQLAHFLGSDPKNNMDEDKIQEEVENFITLVKTRSGLLVERGEGVYTFSHLTFQEYLAACEIKNKSLRGGVDVVWEEIEPHLHNIHWREVILLLLGSLNTYDEFNSALVRRIYEGRDEFEPILHRHLFLSAQALSDYVEVELILRNQIIDTLLALAASHEIANHDAIHALGSFQNDSRLSKGLLVLAGDLEVDALVRSAAGQALGQLGHLEEAGKMLLSLARDEKIEASVRSSAAQALGQLGDLDKAGKLLLSLIGNDKVNIFVQRDAANALIKLGLMNKNGELLMIVAVNEKVDANVRRDAVWMLAQVGHVDEVGRTLLALVENEKVDTFVRRIAVGVLGQLEYVNEVILNGLTAVITDSKADIYIRFDGAQALSQLGHADESAKLLLELAEDQNVDSFVRSAAAQAAGQLGHVDGASRLLLVLARDDSVDVFVRSAAAQELRELGHADEASKLLLDLAGNEKMNIYVRRDAALALAQFKHTDEVIVNGLITLAKDEAVGGTIRKAATWALSELGYIDEAGKQLFVLARDGKLETGVRSAAAQALGRLGFVDEASRILIEMTRDEEVDVFVRGDTAQALGQLGHGDEASRALLVLAEDEMVEIGVRRIAAQALSQLGYVDEACRILFAIAVDRKVDADLRRAAAQSLNQLGRSDEAGEVLLSIAGDEKVSVNERYATAEVLGQLGRKEQASRIVLALAEDQKIVAKARITAAKALNRLGYKDESGKVLLALAGSNEIGIEERANAYEALKKLLG